MKASFLIKNKLVSGIHAAGWRLALLLLLELLITFSSQAQNKVWDKTLGGNEQDFLTAIVATPDGGYLVGGTSKSNKSDEKSENNRDEANLGDHEKGDYWVVKIDASGKKIWDKTFGGNAEDNLTAMVPTVDGGYLLGGTSFSGKSGDKSEDNKATPDENGQITTDYWVVKIDANGKKEWDKTVGGNDYDRLSALLATPDGGYLLGGHSHSGKSGDKTEVRGDYDFWVIKIDSNGKKEWDKTLGGKSLEFLATMVPTSDGGYLLGGTSTSGISGDKSEPSRGSDGEGGDYWVIEIDATGKKIWDKTVGGDRRDELRAIAAAPNGGYLLGGTSTSGKSGDKSADNKYPQDDSGNLLPAFWIVKIDAGGKKIWDKNYGSGSEGEFRTLDELRTMISSPEGGYLLGGASYSGKGGDKSEEKLGYWILKLKKDGTKIWDRTFADGDDLFGADLSAMVATPDKGILLGGTSWSGISGDKSEASRGEDDYWIVKIGDSNKKVQEITLSIPLITKTVGDAPIILSAQATSGLPVSFSVVSGPGTLQDNTLTFTGVGRITVKASQAGNDTYAAATEVLQTIIVEKPSPVTKLWNKRFGGNSNDNLTAMAATPDGGYLLGGASSSNIGGDKSAANNGHWLVKIDKNGVKQWDISLEVNGTYGTTLPSLLVTPDGGYLLGGSSINDVGSNYEIMKIRSNGTKEWEKTFVGGDENNLTAIVATPDGGYLLGGDSYLYESEAGHGRYDYWVIKIDASGNKLWDKRYGGDSYDFLNALVTTPDGGYLLAGYSDSGISGEKSEANRATNGEGYDYWVIKIDGSGKKVWDKTVGGKEQDFLTALVATSDGDYLLGGNSESGKSGDKSESNKDTLDANNYPTSDYWLVKLDSQGKKVWDKTLGGKDRDGLAEIITTTDGGYLLGGSSTSGLGEDKTGENRGGQDYWVVRIDAQGQKIWDKTYGTSQGDIFSTLVGNTDNSYLLGGYTNAGMDGDKSEPGRGNTDYWVIKIKEELPFTAQWDMRYGGTGNDNFTVAIKTSDGSYLSGGYTNSGVSGDKSQSSQGKNDYWIVKSDKNGTKLWEKRYGGTADDYLNRIIQTQDGGYLLGGSSLSGISGDKTEASQGGRDYWVLKVDKQGNKQWDKTYGGSGYDELKKVIPLASGEYVLGGSSNSPVSGDKSQNSQGGSDYWLVKIKADGTKLWDKRFGGSQEETLGSFTETRDGGFFLGGSSWSGQSGDKSQASRGANDYWAVKTDKDGNLLWEKTFGSSGMDEVYSVRRSHGDNLYLAGTSNSGKNGDKSQASQGGKDYWLIKLDEQGTKLWDRTFGGSKDDELRASTFTDEGYYFLAGHSYSDISGDKTQNSQGGGDYWVVQIAANGDKIADQRFGGSGAEELRTVFQTNDGGLLLGGRSDSDVSGNKTQPSQGGTDYWLVKLAPVTTSIVAEREATPEEEPVKETERSLLQAYPNPFQEQVRVNFTLPQTQRTTVKVYDSQGRDIATLFQGEAQANQTYQVEWQAGSKVTGMYLLQLQTPTKRCQHKLLLAK